MASGGHGRTSSVLPSKSNARNSFQPSSRSAPPPQEEQPRSSKTMEVEATTPTFTPALGRNTFPVPLKQRTSRSAPVPMRSNFQGNRPDRYPPNIHCLLLSMSHRSGLRLFLLCTKKRFLFTTKRLDHSFVFSSAGFMTTSGR